jgi:hypothetical protein
MVRLATVGPELVVACGDRRLEITGVRRRACLLRRHSVQIRAFARPSPAWPRPTGSTPG